LYISDLALTLYLTLANFFLFMLKKLPILSVIGCLSASLTQAQSLLPPVSVADLNFSVPGLLNVGIWQNEHANQKYEYPSFQYGFAEGDEVILTFNTQNLKGTQNLAVIDVATNTVIYSKQAFQNIENIRFNIPRKAVYAFQLSTNHMLDRVCRLLLQRVPASAATQNFACNVAWKMVPDTVFTTQQRPVIVKRTYRVETIQDAAAYYINSGSNAAFKGGKSRISVPVNLPVNTVKWYYKVAATRSQADIDKASASVDLLVDLTRIAARMTLQSSFAADVLGKGVEALTQPTGSSYCDVYLLDTQNIEAFLNKENFSHFREATRENIQAGAVKVPVFKPGQLYYLGIRNPDSTVGESVSVEIGAIVADEVTAMQTIKIPVSVGQKKVAFFGN